MKHVNHILLRVVTQWHVASLEQPEQGNQQQEEEKEGGKAEIKGIVSKLLSILTAR